VGLQIGLGSRIRKSPFHEALVRHGLTHVTVYNHMHIPPDLNNLADKCQTARTRKGFRDYAVSCQ